ncbi:MAG TPA: cytochrome c [Gammaproteobacteria bacterium]|nr:cytochrome c [Gammaproteobacteria bacterium]
MKKLRPALLSLALIPTVYLTVTGVIEQPGKERQQQLRQVLAQNCSVCHGKSLQGDVGPALNPKTLGGKNEDMLVSTILQGREGTIMPSWSWMLKENEARWLVRFLRSEKK